MKATLGADQAGKPDPTAKRPDATRAPRGHTALGYRRDYLGNRFVYVTLSSRSRGLSIGINLTPGKQCNFNCVYCDVDRSQPGEDAPIDLDVLSAELLQALAWAREGTLRNLPPYRHIPAELLPVREVALSGEGEPTLAPQFAEVMQTIGYLRAVGPFFKLVLVTNGTGLHLPAVKQGLQVFTSRDEIWVKLDAGTQAHLSRINRTHLTLKKVLANLLQLGRERSIIIQSLFPALNEQGPTDQELEAYVQRLQELKAGGAQISLVQIYSAQKPTAVPECGHLSLPALTNIAQRIQAATGLNAEVF